MSRVLLAFLCFTLLPSLALAIHEEEGVVNDNIPLVIGSPDFPRSVYSGIRLRILPEAPTDLRFKLGQAAWLDADDAAVVDTEIEQSVFASDINDVVTLPRNTTTTYGNSGLVIGDLLPQDYYGPFPNQLGPSHLAPYIEVSYRLTGSDAILSGSIESFAFVPEPKAVTMVFIGVISMLRLRKRV